MTKSQNVAAIIMGAGIVVRNEPALPETHFAQIDSGLVRRTSTPGCMTGDMSQPQATGKLSQQWLSARRRDCPE